MEVVELTADQLGALTEWSAAGAEFTRIAVHGTRPPYAETWHQGDIVAVQGDAHVQISARGAILDAVPPSRLERGGGTAV